jgi:tetrahydromethanopterin S-methyltransferase subunit G
MAPHRATKMIGVIFGCLVVGVMLFMMIAVLSGMLSGDK